jgi:hypothetical protein
MKIIFRRFISVSLIIVTLGFNFCSKSVLNVTSNLSPLQPTEPDTNAGNWKTILLATPNQLAIPIPSTFTSPEYLSELAQIKDLQKKATADQKKAVEYWAAGNVLRWNEILRELVAKYNLPSVANTDGTYPIPSPSNPLSYPFFPFSNPPYAARAYAYISTAQYDALVATYYYKALYNRKSPYDQDPTINALVPKSVIASYPSETGVLAGVTAEMMKLLFPNEVATITAKAHEAEMSAILSGAASPSDINAGDSLGKHIADVFIAKAKTDNAKSAVGTPPIWASFETIAQGRGETAWMSLENPKRPPMLPLFGKVRSLMLDSVTLLSLRPGPPPSTTSEQMKQELEAELQYTLHPTANNIRITQFWADGVGTPTPAGHWNFIACQDFIHQNYSEVRWARNLAYLNMTLMNAAIVCWDTKYAYFSPRPSQLNPNIKTLTGVPNFPSYISGHSTFSGAASTFLSFLIPSKTAEYTQMANEASESRIVSGIHYKSDCTVGLTVGNAIGNLSVEKLKNSGGN